MSTWDGRCKRCRRLMSICKCFVGGGGAEQNNPNGGNSDDGTARTIQIAAHGKRHLFETLKDQHPLRSHVLVSIHGDLADRRAHQPTYIPHHKPGASSARSRTDARASVHRPSTAAGARRPPSSSAVASSSVPVSSSHISRPSTSASSHRHSSPVPRDSAAIPMPTSRSDPAAIRHHQTQNSSSSSARPSSSSHRRAQPEDPPQYYVGNPVLPEESDPATYEL